MLGGWPLAASNIIPQPCLSIVLSVATLDGLMPFLKRLAETQTCLVLQVRLAC
jgi:hypothetical protein